MKEFLSHRGLSFSVRGVDDDDSAYDELIALGYRSVPVTVIDTTVVKGFDPAALSTAIGQTIPVASTLSERKL